MMLQGKMSEWWVLEYFNARESKWWTDEASKYPNEKGAMDALAAMLRHYAILPKPVVTKIRVLKVQVPAPKYEMVVEQDVGQWRRTEWRRDD